MDVDFDFDAAVDVDFDFDYDFDFAFVFAVPAAVGSMNRAAARFILRSRSARSKCSGRLQSLRENYCLASGRGLTVCGQIRFSGGRSFSSDSKLLPFAGLQPLRKRLEAVFRKLFSR